MAHTLKVRPGSSVDLTKFDSADTGGLHSKDEAQSELQTLKKRLFALQQHLYADNRHALLIVFQAMDGGGKDGVIRQVMSGINPQGCEVTSFKAPSLEERQHDFLWRIHQAVPSYGRIGIFNRSHYEDVLIARVKGLVPPEIWEARYEMINRFEEHLHGNRVTVLKFYLHISKEEQAERFVKRLVDPKKNWKFDPADLEERKRWDAYMEAYAAALGRCSTPQAPWYVIPSDRKWYRDLAVARVLVEALEALPLQWPELSPETAALASRARETGELPESASPADAPGRRDAPQG